ncbi:MAG: GNAT family N-acetyltransferase [Planctomycetota bacterium]|jgi:phosphinothricin acetyltransferase
MDIRVACEGDLAEIVAIYNQAVTERGATADLTLVSVDARREWFAEHSPETYPIWVAQGSDGIVGWCSLSAYRPGRMALRHTAEISYYVDAGHRRQGVARGLIQHAIGQCPALQMKNLFCLLLDVNVPSIRLLETLGFVQWGHMPDVAEFDGRRCGHLIYGRRV